MGCIKNISFKLVLLLLLLASPHVSAQLFTEAPADKQEGTAEIPEDSLGRRTPRGTVSGFFDAVGKQNYDRASRYLKLKRSQQKEKERIRIVKVFQRLLDQGGNIMPYTWLSNKTTGRLDDDIAQELDLVGTVKFEDKEIELFVENTATGNAPPLWHFSQETVKSIASLTIEEELLLDRILPQGLKERMLAGVPLGHWIAVVLLVVFAYLLSWALIASLSLILRAIWKKARTKPTRSLVEAFELPFRLYLAVWIFISLTQEIGISIIVRQRFSGITVTIGIIAILILLWRLADLISTLSKDRMSRSGRVSAISVILFLRRTAKVALIFLGAIAVLSAIGVDVTTWFAALGIGGLALALGAQKTIENFVGSVTLITDQPIRVGDFCKIGDVSGTVEQIGVRSSKIRTGERTVITIPNGDLSASRIENFAHRDRFLFSPTLELRLETTPDQIRYLLVELRALLYSHPMVNPDPAKVRFTGFGTSSLKLEFWAYIDAPGYDQFQEAQEDILLRIMDIIESSGTALAVPAQTVYMARDKGKSEEKTAAAEDKVRKWKKNNELQLPVFDIDKINEIKNTIKYPPEGSVSRNKEDGTSEIPAENKL